MLRDLLAGETPQLVLPGPINYLAAILGAIIYVGMVEWAGIDKVVSEWVAIAIVFGLRMIALRYGIKAPEPVDVPRHVRRTVLGSRRSAAPRHARCTAPAASAGPAAPGEPGPSSGRRHRPRATTADGRRATATAGARPDARRPSAGTV